MITGTYDVQGIRIHENQVNGSMGFKCTFAPGALSQQCRVTLCRVDDITNYCENVTNNGIDITYLFGFSPGLYTVKEAAQVKDGQVIVLHQAVLKYMALYFPDVEVPGPAHITSYQCMQYKFVLLLS